MPGGVHGQGAGAGLIRSAEPVSDIVLSIVQASAKSLPVHKFALVDGR